MSQLVYSTFERREEMNATKSTAGMSDRSRTWEFGTRQVVYAAIGAALYGVLSYATNIFPLPAAGNVTFRPAVAVLIFFGIAYAVGRLLAGFGNMLRGLRVGGFIELSLGNGLMGMIPGLGDGYPDALP
jgi:energy-coupling factor transport system substrate-specific component